VDEIKLSNAEREHYYKVVDDNEKRLNDHEKRLGKVEDRVKLILYIFVGIVTPLLAAIGAGVVKLLQAGHP